MPRTPAPAAAPATGDFTQYASARQAEARAEEQTVVAMILRGPQSADDVGMSMQGAVGSMFSNEMLRALSQSELHGRST